MDKEIPLRFELVVDACGRNRTSATPKKLNNSNPFKFNINQLSIKLHISKLMKSLRSFPFPSNTQCIEFHPIGGLYAPYNGAVFPIILNLAIRVHNIQLQPNLALPYLFKFFMLFFAFVTVASRALGLSFSAHS